ncbi:MAG TPA: phosphonate metabolism protein/1,5-bisphosphokinase (PRPP-forming) PhnN [Stellaceae bacterium]|nr:phosphonate metabolism protein/1,5-bisphosphokinase (PRPP-forming) PhnN [Stellaceae bacterium]
MTRRGTLVLVVGPSGVGKDSIIAGAAARLRDESRVVFARRLITRPADAGGEDHIAVSPTEFAAQCDTGGLMLHWNAHGLDYGLPQTLSDRLDSGHAVVANVSRTVVAKARQRLAPVLVIAIAASPETLASRLAARGRETAGDIAERLARSGALAPGAADVVIDNDGSLDDAVDRFVGVLRELVE